MPSHAAAAVAAASHGAPSGASGGACAGRVVATAEVQVTNVNDVVNFTANTGALGVYAIGAGAESALVIPGLRVEDKDHDVDPVRVYIHSSSMYSSFSLERLSEEPNYFYGVG